MVPKAPTGSIPTPDGDDVSDGFSDFLETNGGKTINSDGTFDALDLDSDEDDLPDRTEGTTDSTSDWRDPRLRRRRHPHPQ